ncbi:MAG: hypothetical protein LBI45_06225 [Bacteroidales bacterium]|jgi:hypothetical protein|nr:hypothetical protein [Bacteroidales bacterium]
MESKTWHDIFLDALHKKFPNKLQLTKELMNLLELEREATYRRLRKEVSFSTQEMAKIVTTWRISLDEISRINSEQFSFQMKPMNYLKPSKEEQNFLKTVVRSLRLFQNEPTAEIMDICNKIPHSLLSGFDYLNQFYFFKWNYFYGNDTVVTPYSEVSLSKAEKKIMANYYKAIKHVPISSFIWDYKIIEYLVSDIRYFHSIYLITDTEKELIKKDLYALLEYMFIVANKGCYPETQNKVNLYISELNVETNYTYTLAPQANICFVIVFEIYEIFSFNTEMVSNFMAWMQLKKKTSTQISEVDERSRIEFFKKQRELVDHL